ncbi:hypothetical protein Y1Q_0015418 [Alligator mississippiensis]|uniref:Uncharacterized protein n=1 Tax=Alligator mississippiensis TaxID=8496 RepID=A0A151NCU0_ALLMI|nr:hypothetical protein Y1Q_0015418 [Alligator mississippiensis]
MCVCKVGTYYFADYRCLQGTQKGADDEAHELAFQSYFLYHEKREKEGKDSQSDPSCSEKFWRTKQD